MPTAITKENKEEDDNDSYVGGSATSNCEIKGCEDGNRLKYPFFNHSIGLSEDCRNQSGLKSQYSPTAAEGVVGYAYNSLPRRGKKKRLSELGEPSTLPRRSVRLSEKTSQAREILLPSEGLPTTLISDGDINNCNACVRISGSSEEPTDLWVLGKQIGLACRGVEEEVVQEFQCMEDRDLEFEKNVEVGNLNAFFADF